MTWKENIVEVKPDVSEEFKREVCLQFLEYLKEIEVKV